MIGSVLKGGLGNMMFQIAAAEAVSQKINVEAVFYPRTTGIVHRQVDAYVDNIFRNVTFDQSPQYLNTYHEPSFSYHKLPEYDHFLYDGHFQSEKYFYDCKDYIRKIFSPTESFIAKTLERYPDISKSCGIHVRRGDYLNFPDIHPVMRSDYFKRGIGTIESLDKDCNNVYVFTNDEEWCKTNLDMRNIIIVKNENDWEDLWIMSLCKNYVISNSSFSWWSAWLGSKDGSITIAPDSWFGPRGPQDTQDLYCKDWIRIKN